MRVFQQAQLNTGFVCRAVRFGGRAFRGKIDGWIDRYIPTHTELCAVIHACKVASGARSTVVASLSCNAVVNSAPSVLLSAIRS